MLFVLWKKSKEKTKSHNLLKRRRPNLIEFYQERLLKVYKYMENGWNVDHMVIAL